MCPLLALPAPVAMADNRRGRIAARNANATAGEEADGAADAGGQQQTAISRGDKVYSRVRQTLSTAAAAELVTVQMTVQEDVTDPARPVAATVLLEAADGTRRAQQLTARQPFATTSSAARNVNFGATTGRTAAPLLKLAPGEQLVGIVEPRQGGRDEPAARPTAGVRTRERSRSRSPPSRLPDRSYVEPEAGNASNHKYMASTLPLPSFWSTQALPIPGLSVDDARGIGGSE